ncbi:hypothetical protein BDR26DRAFT_854076 [Obelidium mucronatum]|nr:hypothetical protein BDR26DRAFT_854076 [Obelidium mucronatum]
MILKISSSCIVQDVVTDCSFVASLCVSAAYEGRFKKQLITGCIHPQNADGIPIYNPSGKYIVKLFFNGVYRKIVVDDYLPVSQNGVLMCTYAVHKSEFWPSIIEKAYMKLNGGYDFPGSNSGIDLYALTGWIPEQIFINDSKWNADIQWKRILSGFNSGRGLVTLATIDMPETIAVGIGLVPTHAYAVLNVCEVLGQKMIQLKNPWNHRRWNGKFSHLDSAGWTPQLCEALKFNRQDAVERDDGIFWIHFESVIQHFESIHVNWSPAMFIYQHVMHVSWPFETGPAVDAYTLAHNPQYGLEVDAQADGATIWLLLSKHITIKEENKDYITLHVYSQTNCRRVYYPDMYRVIYVGVYVNSPHILASIQVPKGKSRHSVVVSQHEKIRSLTFSLRAYGKHPFRFGAIGDEYPLEEKLEHFLNGGTGGEAAQTWEIQAKQGQLLLMTESHNQVSMELKLMDIETGKILCDSGSVRPKFACIEYTVPRRNATFKAIVSISGASLLDRVGITLIVRSDKKVVIVTK